MALPVQAPSVNRGRVRGDKSDGINPSACNCTYSCNGKNYSRSTVDCNGCNAIAKADCGLSVIPLCECMVND